MQDNSVPQPWGSRASTGASQGLTDLSVSPDPKTPSTLARQNWITPSASPDAMTGSPAASFEHAATDRTGLEWPSCVQARSPVCRLHTVAVQSSLPHTKCGAPPQKNVWWSVIQESWPIIVSNGSDSFLRSHSRALPSLDEDTMASWPPSKCVILLILAEWPASNSDGNEEGDL